MKDALGYYKVLEKMGVQIINNHADYRLMSKRVCEEFLNYKESNLFLRGIVTQLGFKSTIVGYERKERMAGESKYPLKKMLALAWNGITSFSVVTISRIMSSMVVLVLVLLTILLAHSRIIWVSRSSIRS